MTKQQIKNKIADLEQWLNDHHPEDEQRPEIVNQLQRLQQELNQKDYEDYN